MADAGAFSRTCKAVRKRRQASDRALPKVETIKLVDEVIFASALPSRCRLILTLLGRVGINHVRISSNRNDGNFSCVALFRAVHPT